MMMMMLMSVLVILVLKTMFFMNKKKEKEEKVKNSTFECGFTSYYYSRFSFSIHYYLVGLIFLFLDLELCVIMPMMSGMSENLKMKSILIIFTVLMLSALMVEWKENKLEWNY